MKLCKRMFALLLVLLLTLSMTALAGAAKESYTYRVTFRAGAQGTFVGEGLTVQGTDYQISRTGETITVTGLHQGDRVTWDNDLVAMGQDNRYYVRGVRLSGRDNDTVDLSSFVVKEDRDYVVAYGIAGETVSYQIHYVDESGKSLRKSRTMHGNVGDKPVVACAYIEGYLPQAYNLTGTLKADESKNVFTFVYKSVTSTQNNEGNTNTDQTNNNSTNRTTNNTTNRTNNNTTTNNTTTNNSTTTNNATENAAATNNSDGNTTDTEAQQGEGNGETTEDTNTVQESEPAQEDIPEVVDLDDNETPLAGAEENGVKAEIGNEAIRVGAVIRVVAILVGIALVGGCIWWMMAGRKKKEKKQ